MNFYRFNNMRRTDKEINDPKVIEKILKRAEICRIALIDDNKSYIVPMNYGYKDGCIYLHSASEGRKIEILRKNNSVCFEMDCKKELLKSKNPCKYGMKYYSLIGWGNAKFVNDFQEKIKSLDIIMQKYASNTIFKYDEQQVNHLTIIVIEINELTGKTSGY